MSNQASNHLKYLVTTKVIDFANDEFRIILMESGFVFNKDTHALYGDVIANELPTLNGYTQGDKVLSLTAVTEDDTDDRCEVTWDPVSWTAGGGNIGPSPGAIIYDNTAADDPIVGYIDFGGEYTQAAGGTATLNNLELRLS